MLAIASDISKKKFLESELRATLDRAHACKIESGNRRFDLHLILY